MTKLLLIDSFFTLILEILICETLLLHILHFLRAWVFFFGAASSIVN